MSENILQRITDTLRSSVRVQDAVLVSLQLAAWVVLSEQGKLPAKLALDSAKKPRGGSELAQIFHDLSEQIELGDTARAFAFLEGVIRQIDDIGLARALELCETLHRSGLIGPQLVDDAIQAMLLTDPNFHGIPDEVSELLVALADVSPDMSAYCPFDDALQLCALVEKRNARSFTEVMHSSPLPWLAKILKSPNVAIRTADPIRQPSFVGAGKLTQFNVVICFPPLGWRREFDLTNSDLFGRFPEKTTSGTVLSIRHALSQSKGRVVIAVPNSLLFSLGAEKSLRKSLIENGNLECVISLPTAMLSTASVQFSVLILRNDIPCRSVRFIDATSANFHVRDGRGRSVLRDWQYLADVALGRAKHDCERTVNPSEIKQSDFNFLPSRYCVSADRAALDSMLAKRPYVVFDDLVEFLRPVPPSKNLGIEALEVTVSDIPEFGYVRPPQKPIMLEERSALGARQFIKPLDILIAVKGSAGKVGIVSPSISDDMSPKWVCGQSCLIVRVRPQGPLSPQALFIYLKSKIGQALLKDIVTGATIPLIQLTELRKLAILLLTPLESAEAAAAFERQVALQEQIELARAEQEEISANIFMSENTHD